MGLKGTLHNGPKARSVHSSGPERPPEGVMLEANPPQWAEGPAGELELEPYTSSMRAMGALSPWRGPTFKMRV